MWWCTVHIVRAWQCRHHQGHSPKWLCYMWELCANHEVLLNKRRWMTESVHCHEHFHVRCLRTAHTGLWVAPSLAGCGWPLMEYCVRAVNVLWTKQSTCEEGAKMGASVLREVVLSSLVLTWRQELLQKCASDKRPTWWNTMVVRG